MTEVKAVRARARLQPAGFILAGLLAFILPPLFLTLGELAYSRSALPDAPGPLGLEDYIRILAAGFLFSLPAAVAAIFVWWLIHRGGFVQFWQGPLFGTAAGFFLAQIFELGAFWTLNGMGAGLLTGGAVYLAAYGPHLDYRRIRLPPMTDHSADRHSV